MTARTARAHPRVAVSYAWKEETAGPNREAVEKFCKELRAADVEVTRDQDDAEFGDDLMRFMCDIGHSDSLCVFMSKAYLESFCCMYEFLVAWCRSLDKPEEFQKRVHIWLMDDAMIYTDPAQRGPLIEVWSKRSAENKAYAEKLLNRGSLGEGTLKHINRIQQIEHSIDAMVQHACDHHSPRTWQELATIVIAQHRVEEKRRADQVFENICTEINAALMGNRRAADLFHEVAPDLFGSRSLEIAAALKVAGYRRSCLRPRTDLQKSQGKSGVRRRGP
ncbi:MAG UNVERIFIED_CONTAM: toll/interleukin-1 receptor domain-containing protein [Planctomycetaceae bacterium]|jgi:hypothetical protein